MPSLQDFTMFVQSTGVKLATSPDNILNDAVLNTYFLGRMLKGRSAAESVQSGESIVDRIQLNDVGTAEFYSPNDDMDIQNVDSMVSIKTNWRFIADHYAYTKQEVDLNSGNPQTYYKNLLKAKRQQCKTSTFNKMEAALWDAPSNADMESASGQVPYSIPSLITTDGLAPSGFTTLMTVNVTNEAGWRNQVEEFDPSNITDADSGLIRAMDRMWHKVRFISPSGGPSEYFNSDRLQKMVIATNLDGITLMQRLARDSNDRLIPANNLGWIAGKPVYAGLPVDYVAKLDTALINGGAAITANEPWFYYLNLEFLFPIFHSTAYMQEMEPKDHPRQPFSKVVWSTTYYNMFMRSRKRQGIIVPNNLS